MTEDLQQLIERQLAALDKRQQELLALRQTLEQGAGSEAEPEAAPEKKAREKPATKDQPKKKSPDQPGKKAVPKNTFPGGRVVSRFQEPVEYRQMSEEEMRKLFLSSKDRDGQQKIIDVIYSLGEATMTTLTYYLTATPGVLAPRLLELEGEGVIKSEGPLWIPARPGLDTSE